jgi:hypothetical protein
MLWAFGLLSKITLMLVLYLVKPMTVPSLLARRGQRSDLNFLSLKRSPIPIFSIGEDLSDLVIENFFTPDEAVAVRSQFWQAPCPVYPKPSSRWFLVARGITSQGLRRICHFPFAFSPISTSRRMASERDAVLVGAHSSTWSISV